MARAFQKLGRYLIVSEIARGGMATVYRAKLMGAAGFEKDVAIKKILPYWSHQKEFVDMLINEAKILVHLHHNNIVQVIELGKEGESYFIVMEYVNGFDLRRVLKRLKETGQRLSLGLACFIIKEVCQGLSFAHSRRNIRGEPLNIVHRDISPQNILINREGAVKITDFGIAKSMGRTQETATGVLKGKFSYMSPEQALGQRVTHHTDIFAVGSLFFELITGQKCFDGDNDLEIIEKVKTAQIAQPADIPAPLLKIIHKAMAKTPADRFKTAEELRLAIARAEKQLGLAADSQALQTFLENLFDTAVIETTVEKQALEKKTRVLIPTGITQATTIVNQRTVIDDATRIHEETRKGSALPRHEKPRVTKAASPTIKPVTVTVFALAVICLVSLNVPLPEKPAPAKPPPKTHPLPHRIQTLFLHSGALPNGQAPTALPQVKPYASLMARIALTTVPKDARLDVNFRGKSLALTGGFEHEFQMQQPEESLTVLVTRPGYKAKHLKFAIHSKNLEINQQIKLKPIGYGHIHITARPWATATIKDVGRKVAPATFKVPAGEQLVSVYFPPQKKSLAKTVTVAEGKSVYCRATFGNNRSYLVCR